MVKSVLSFSSASKIPAVAVMFKGAEWGEDSESFYIKYKILLLGVDDSEKASCDYYIFSGLESKELYVRWRKDVHIRVYNNFPIKEARGILIAELVFGEAKAIYNDDPTMTEITNDRTFMRSIFQSDDNYLLFKASDRYIKGERENTFDTIQNFVFGIGDLGNFSYTYQKDTSGISSYNWDRQSISRTTGGA